LRTFTGVFSKRKLREAQGHQWKRSCPDEPWSVFRVLLVIFGDFMYSKPNGIVIKSIGVEQHLVKESLTN
jgi:hypothetical protein